MSPTTNLTAALWRSLRPHQWIKNVLIFGGLAFTGRWHLATSGFGLKAFIDWRAIGVSLAAFAVFCALSSAGYLVNDIRDLEADRQHPDKRHRPIASGALPVRVAWIAALGLFVAAAVGAWFLSRRAGTLGFWYSALAYLLLTNWYSFQLKRYVIIDVLVIALLFVLRAIAGCVVIPTAPSVWIIACTLFGALFIALCKRRGELVVFAGQQADGGGDAKSRPVLAQYLSDDGPPTLLLDQMVQVAAAATILTYAQYTFVRPAEIGMHGEQLGLMATIPFVVYGVLRYLFLVHKRDIGQRPEQLFRDRAMLLNLVLWGLMVVFVTRGRML